jgi:hypothetical protein
MQYVYVGQRRSRSTPNDDRGGHNRSQGRTSLITDGHDLIGEHPHKLLCVRLVEVPWTLSGTVATLRIRRRRRRRRGGAHLVVSVVVGSVMPLHCIL